MLYLLLILFTAVSSHVIPKRNPLPIRSIIPLHPVPVKGGCSLLNIGCDIKKAEQVIHSVEKEIDTDVKKVQKKIDTDIKKVKLVIKKDIQKVNQFVKKVEPVIKKELNQVLSETKKAILLQRDIQYGLKLLRSGEKVAKEAWLESKKATKALSHTLSKVGNVANIVTIAVEDICLDCSPQCNMCRIGVDELVAYGKGATCGIMVPAACEIIGLGPEDPLSDACALGLGIVCSKLSDKLTSSAHPKELCHEIKAC